MNDICLQECRDKQVVWSIYFASTWSSLLESTSKMLTAQNFVSGIKLCITCKINNSKHLFGFFTKLELMICNIRGLRVFSVSVVCVYIAQMFHPKCSNYSLMLYCLWSSFNVFCHSGIGVHYLNVPIQLYSWQDVYRKSHDFYVAPNVQEGAMRKTVISNLTLQRKKHFLFSNRLMDFITYFATEALINGHHKCKGICDRELSCTFNHV